MIQAKQWREISVTLLVFPLLLTNQENQILNPCLQAIHLLDEIKFYIIPIFTE